MTNPIIQLTDISASYDEKTVLSHINLTVYEHDFLGVIGPNGGGKTTLIKIILGLLKPISGTIRFYKNGKEIPEIAMGYLPQYNSIDKKFPISVYEVVLSGLNKQKSLFHRYTPEPSAQSVLQTLFQVQRMRLLQSQFSIYSLLSDAVFILSFSGVRFGLLFSSLQQVFSVPAFYNPVCPDISSPVSDESDNVCQIQLSPFGLPCEEPP